MAPFNGFIDGLRRRFGTQPEVQDLPEEPPRPSGPPQDLTPCAGMRAEVTGMAGDLLFIAELANIRGDQAELRQISTTSLAQDQEPLRVRIRGYQERARSAFSLEATISPMPGRVWQAEDIVMTQAGNDRAFFRLETNLEATATSFRGSGAEERPCRLLNISVGGARIRSEYIYHPGDRFMLKMQLLDERDPSAIYCQVLRVIEKEGVKGREYGCRFLELSEADQDRITENIFAAQKKRRNRGN